MAYEKRVLVLRQIKKGFTADGSALTGAIYAERLGSDLTITPRIAGIAPVKEGRYALALWIDGRQFVVEMKGEAMRIPDAPSIKRGFSALLVFVRGEAEPLAYGNCGIAPADFSPLLAAVDGRALAKAPEPPADVAPRPLESAPLAPSENDAREEDPQDDPFRDGAEYDDEAIAATDYFRPDAGDADAAARGGGAGEDGDETQKDDVHPFGVARKTLTYYYSVKDKIDAAFRAYPKDTRLNAAFPHSEWVKSDVALIGVIYEGGLPKYLCVAVEGKTPPDEMKERSCFVPSTPFSDEEGFWVVFQSADSGEYVTVKEG